MEPNRKGPSHINEIYGELKKRRIGNPDDHMDWWRAEILALLREARDSTDQEEVKLLRAVTAAALDLHKTSRITLSMDNIPEGKVLITRLKDYYDWKHEQENSQEDTAGSTDG